MSVAYAATWWALPGTVGAGVLKTEKSSCSKPKSQAAQTRKLETIKHNLTAAESHSASSVPSSESWKAI